MNEIEQITLGINDIQSAWDTFRQLETLDGVRLEVAWTAWAEEQRKRLASPGARSDFDELCQAGCVQEILASILAVPTKNSVLTELVEFRQPSP